MASTWPEPRDTSSTPSWADQPDPAHPVSTATPTGGAYEYTSTARRRPRSAADTSEASRDVASMKKEIVELQTGTTQSLDRAIAAAQAASSVGVHVSEELQEQREQMGHIDADARETEAILKRTGHNLKHGFTWRGALTSPFRRGPKKAPLKGEAHRNIAPVFTDEFNARSSSRSPTRTNNQSEGSRPKSAPSHAGDTGRGGIFGKNSREKKVAADARVKQINGAAEPKAPSAGHVPEGFDKQLDVLDGLMDGLNAQAQAINAELRQQNEGIEVIAGRVEPAAFEAASQARQIKRRFGVRGA